MGIDGKTCRTLADAKTMADAWVGVNDNPLDRLKLAMLTLGFPKEVEEYIAAKWKESGFKPLSEYAPVAAHVLSVEFFFQIALGASLINPGRPSNRIDVAYLSYAPFCMVFVSGDNLHRKVAPHFLRNDQSFVWGPDLKADLQRLVEKYRKLPKEMQELGLMKYAHLPPDEEQYLITVLYKKHFPPRPAPSFDAPDEPIPTDYKPLPTDEKELLARLKRFRECLRKFSHRTITTLATRQWCRLDGKSSIKGDRFGSCLRISKVNRSRTSKPRRKRTSGLLRNTENYSTKSAPRLSD